MEIALRYENVPHFCFSCGRIGHAVANCPEGETGGQGINFGEELRASPPRCSREISVKNLNPRVTRPLFQAGLQQVLSTVKGSERTRKGSNSEARVHADVEMEGMKGYEPGSQHQGSLSGIKDELADSVRGMTVACKDEDIKDDVGMWGSKERVSFGTNMSTDDESSESGSVQQSPARPSTAVERFHAKCFGGASDKAGEKKAALKVQGAGTSKKQKTPVKRNIKGMIEALEEGNRENVQNQDKMEFQGKGEEVHSSQDALLKLDPNHLTGTPEEARQEQ
jgi:hypothetical protein